MKPLLLFFILSSSLPALAAIYGHDDRMDIYQVPQYAEVAQAVAVAVGHVLIEKNADGTSRVDLVDKLGDFACHDERFANQPSLGVCTGFLIGDRYLVTAGHCALPTGVINDEDHPFCQDIDWYFGYNVKADGSVNDQHIPDNRLYRCKRVIRAENIERLNEQDPQSPPGNDFTLIELDRPVSADIRPLSLAKKPAQKGDRVYTIGHPSGLPAKFSGLAPVLSTPQPHYFTVNLDTEGGNSGGPVLNDHNEVVGILVSGHPVDYYTDPKLGCDRANVCDENGFHCNEESKFPGLQHSNYVQRIETLLGFLPKD